MTRDDTGKRLSLNMTLQGTQGVIGTVRTITACSVVCFGLAIFCALTSSAGAATVTVSVTDYGAIGDAIQTLAATTLNSTNVTLQTGNTLSSADVGKLIELFGVGASTTPTNNQDLIAIILGVTNGTNVAISVPAGISSNAVPCTIGTQNAQAFQQCVNACQGTNTVVLVPPGRYLMVPSAMLAPAFVMKGYSATPTAVTIQKGGIQFLGTDPASTILLGNGAWSLNNNYVIRGWLFACVGPVTNSGSPLVFQNLTMDGGVQQGRTASDNGGPARTTDGGGWDVTHDAVVDQGPLPLHACKVFQNCRFVHWRGEMVKSVTTFDSGLIVVTNCSFIDGNGSGYNFNWTPHVISGCLFSNLFMAMEYYVGTMKSPSVFENSTITNVLNAIVLVGALSNNVEPTYTIGGNTIAPSKFGILFSPVQNLVVTGNQFLGGLIGLDTDNYAYQGTAINSNILVQNNTFIGTGECLNIGSGGQDSVVDVMFATNTAWGCGRFADGDGWSSNVVFLGNTSVLTNGQQGRLFGSQLIGQYFIDDDSNVFPTNMVYLATNNPANTISYADGMRHSLMPASPNCAAILDTDSPAQIPPGAMLEISNGGWYPVILYLSSQAPVGSPATVKPGYFVKCAWTNGVWRVVQPPTPAPPQDLRSL
jgi:hypothetical protein